MASQAEASDSTTPLLPHAAAPHRRRSSHRSWRSASHHSFQLRRASTNEVHPRPDEIDPVLPATALDPGQETRLHNTNWAGADGGEPNTWAQIRHAWREEFA